MNSAELKTLRSGLGLSVLWLANKVNVHKRTVEYWEESNKEKVKQIPLDVSTLIYELMDLSDQIIDQIILEKMQERELYPDNELSLIRYTTDETLWHSEPLMALHKLPVNFYGNILFQVKKGLSKKGINSRIIYYY